MSLPEWHEEPISKSHDRKGFDCGDAELNAFFDKHARQNHKAGSSKTFCAIDDANPKRVLGFYSLAPVSIFHELLPVSVTKGLPQHDVGGFQLARIATHTNMQGQGLGGQLLLAAGKRCLRVAAEAGGILLVIDAKNERAAAWYEGYGAIRLEDMPLKLVLPLTTIRLALEAAGKF
ncbi:GNAT family N-acetyltransferase [Telmatospirillum sp.]|uniref:GNAT family N-acetyltransferase n=1 Tax=Telmatospirillum sp. TaxID=2079197 RepID=UPI00284153D4|nr:GNAT family N-acetyltransferase [Telmatospirillum sp.]MDR3436021.1 GNAT family N-acetyltransferase [Telmatospirillum sp.]